MSTKSPELTFITSHPKKAAELAWHLKRPVNHHKLDLLEIQSVDPHEVATFKAQEAYRQLKRPVLVEDFSIRFTALGGLPGPLFKWFLQELQPEGLCELLNHYNTRQAFVQDCFAYCDGGEVMIFDGIREGSIALEPRGEYGYGTDSIFIPKGWDKTWGEMSKEEKMASSVRNIGVKKLEEFLSKRHGVTPGTHLL